MSQCKICGKENCKKHSILLAKPQKITSFSGSSPPEIFVGKWNYPNVYTGILAPQEYGETEIMSSAEEWHRQKLPIPAILKLRSKLIYGRTQSNIHKALSGTGGRGEGSMANAGWVAGGSRSGANKFLPVMQEVAMTYKSVGTEFKLKKPVKPHDEKEFRVPLISHAAPVDKVRLEENAPVKKKIEQLVSDTEVKSAPALVELHKSGIQNTALIKILSAGLLGLAKNRRLVPTRWSITAVDDTLSKERLSRIRHYPEISEFQVFSAYYLGNHYEFLLLPGKWSFEVLERSLKGPGTWQDYETFFPRKKYADSVTGAYYANRLALTEYLEKIKRQCTCIVFREIRPEYDSPLGVGILRQTSRAAFENTPIKFATIKEALDNIQSRIKQPITNYTEKSFLLKNYGKQKRITEFF